eukprot:TRINITY_DN5463_c0_g1_i3.p1 TRINITY_DN5463_c0_g1~~TRINITY_DN5463_c0_g1_i3.p1  ORF type:complete len:1193 (+),score=127.37 TRINITY_DN5463_c0_g1_i3:201-3581(+)
MRGATGSTLFLLTRALSATTQQFSVTDCELVKDTFLTDGIPQLHGPCANHTWGITPVGGKRIYGCHANAVLCDGDGSGSVGNLSVHCRSIGPLGCGFNHVMGVAVDSTRQWLYAACAEFVTRCRWDDAAGLPSSCVPVADALCESGGRENDVIITDSLLLGVLCRGGKLVVGNVSAPGGTTLTVHSRNDYWCGSDIVLGLSLPAPGRVIATCDISRYEYCDIDATLQVSNCQTNWPGGPAPCLLNNIVRLPSGRTALLCQNGEYHLCGATSAPSEHPSVSPSFAPTVAPSTGSPSGAPSAAPTAAPSAIPSPPPSASPSTVPSARPTGLPSTSPTRAPTESPASGAPTAAPTAAPSSAVPTAAPTITPTVSPSSSAPTLAPAGAPSRRPTPNPTLQPSTQPSGFPSARPSPQPSAYPTGAPSFSPSSVPSTAPSGRPSAAPTRGPSASPTGHPSTSPSALPSGSPPSRAPASQQPSPPPSGAPSAQPSASPPSRTPTGSPVPAPSQPPSAAPSGAPSTQQPTAAPSAPPSAATFQPTPLPAAPPSGPPSAAQPSAAPARHPSAAPSNVTDSPTAAPSVHDRRRLPAVAAILLSATVYSVVEAPVPGMTAAALTLESRCPEPERPEELSASLHPLGFEVGGDVLLGALLGNSLLALGCAVLGGLVFCFARVAHGRILEKSPRELHAAVGIPGRFFLAPVLLYQGTAYALARTALGVPPSASVPVVAVACIAGAFNVIFTPLAVDLLVASRAGGNAAYVQDPAPMSSFARFIVGPGEWVNTTAELWFSRNGKVLKDYHPAAARPALCAQFAELTAVSVLSALAVSVDGGCAAFHYALASAFLAHGLWCLRVRPYARPRGQVHEGVLTLLLTAGMVCKAVGYTAGHPSGAELDTADALLSAAALLIGVKLILDVASEVYVRCARRRARLQELQLDRSKAEGTPMIEVAAPRQTAALQPVHSESSQPSSSELLPRAHSSADLDFSVDSPAPGEVGTPSSLHRAGSRRHRRRNAPSAAQALASTLSFHGLSFDSRTPSEPDQRASPRSSTLLSTGYHCGAEGDARGGGTQADSTRHRRARRLLDTAGSQDTQPRPRRQRTAVPVPAPCSARNMPRASTNRSLRWHAQTEVV